MIIEAIEWNDDAAEMLRAATLTAAVEDYRAQVESGAVLFQVSDDSGPVGYYILRVDEYAEKTVGVLVAASGKPGYAFADTIMPIIEKQFIGCEEIQQYCSRAGMVKKLAAQGWEATHLVMKKRINHG